MLQYNFCRVMRLLADRKGVTALEYGVMMAAIVVALMTILGSLGTKLSTTFLNMATAL
jgi:pilus assembly protein Flp/PilA